MDRRRTAGLLLAAAALAGCGGGAGPSASGPAPTPVVVTPLGAGWEEPADYRFAVTSSCGERNFIGDYRVTVEGRRVVAADQLSFDGTAWRPVGPGDLASVPTLGAMLEEADAASGQPEAGEVSVETDPRDGHPVEVRVDHLADAIDDESCYVIEDYQPGG